MRSSRLLVAAAAIVAALPVGATAAPASLMPQNLVLEMRPGQSRTVDYRLAVAAQAPRPTDLYLLVDTSASMQRHLPALRRGIADAMVHLQSWPGLGVGIGEFRTTSAADWNDGLTYRMLRRVGVIDRQLADALDRLGRDEAGLPQFPPGERAHTVALDEAVTGDGYWPYVDAGQQAGFRTGTRKVVVVVTNAPFADDSAQPSRDEAVATLRAAGAEVFGLALNATALGDLTAVATGTRSVAATTVDCGGGRRIAAGRPTACAVSPDAIDTAVAGMLYVRRSSRVTATVSGSGVRRLAPRAWTINPNHHAQMRLRLEVGCAANDAGRTHDIRLTASQGGERVAQASVTLHCAR